MTHPHGSFCFAELHTPDVDGAKRFYSELLGWTAADAKAGGYSLFQLDGKDVAGLRKTTQGAPRWIPFLAVPSADAASATALQAGAAVVSAPADTAGMARTALLRDPAGGVVGLWEAKGHAGAVIDQPGSMWWAELLTRDVPVAKTFYSNLVGWRGIDTLKYGIRYSVFKLGDESMAGLLPIGADWGNSGPYWQILFAVDDCDARVERAKKAGGSLFFGPNDVPNAGRAAVIDDPAGARFVLMQPNR